MKNIIVQLVAAAVLAAGPAAAETVVESIDLAGVDRVFEGGIVGGDGFIITNSSDVAATITLNVPEGVTATYDGYFGGKINMVKNGGGTQAFSKSNDNNYVHATGSSQINAGTLSICRNENIPYGLHTFADGTCLEINYSFTTGGENSNVYKFLGAVELRVANAGQTATFSGKYVDWEGAVVTKTGPGALKPSAWNSNNTKVAKMEGLRLIIAEGTLYIPSGNTFSNHAANHGVTFECRENGRIRCDDNNAFTDLTFRGGTMYSTTMQRLGSKELSCNRTGKIENPLEWKDFSLNGLVTVKASPLGSNTLFRAYQIQIGNEGKNPVIDVEDGATLTIDSEIWPGRYYSDIAAALRWSGCPYSTATSWVRGSITKRGAGTLELLGAVMIGGTLKVEAGTLVLGPGARLSSAVKLEVAPEARLVLGDRQSVDGAVAWTDGPDVWFDATRLTGYADGETVAAVPNLGGAGGAFSKSAALPATMASGGAQAGLPVYKAAGMNGKPTLWFDGSSALMLDTYSNFTNTLSVFIAYDWTSWAAEAGAGKWASPVSLMRADNKTGFRDSGNGDDNNQYGCFTLQHSDANKLAFCCGFKSVNWDQMTLTSTDFVNVPFVLSAVHNDGLFLFSAHADGVIDKDRQSATLKASDPATNSVINRVCLGGRLRYGYPQVFTDSTKNRMLIGNIGELIVFTRALSEEESRAIVGYLRGKWANVQVAGAAATPAPATARRVAVAAGATAEWAVAGAGGTLKKEGAGTLRAAAGAPDRVEVAAGALRLAPGRLYSRVQMWVDPSDADAVTTNAAGQVVSVRNKGNLGGAFGPGVGKNGGTVATPWTTNINGVAALGFHNEQALVYDGFTNRAARGEAAMNVYMVLRIDDSYELANGRGKWMGAFSMSTVTATADDNNTPGNFHIEWNGDTTNRVPVHGVSSSDTGTYADSTGWKWLSAAQPPYEAALIVIKKRPYSFLAYEEIAADLVTAVTNNMGVYSYAQPAQNIDRVALGNRLTKGGAVQYDSTNAERNRGFNGQIGEFIVTQHALSDEDEKALLAYLRKKWFDKGTGSADAPECLTGAPAGGPDLAGTALKLADGTTLVDEAACLPLASLEAAAGAGFERRGNPSALFDVAGDISLAGTLTFLMDPLPADGRTTLFTYGGAATEPAAWQILSADAKNTRIVHNVNQKRFEYRVTTPGLTLVIR